MVVVVPSLSPPWCVLAFLVVDLVVLAYLAGVCVYGSALLIALCGGHDGTTESSISQSVSTPPPRRRPPSQVYVLHRGTTWEREESDGNFVHKCNFWNAHSNLIEKQC